MDTFIFTVCPESYVWCRDTERCMSVALICAGLSVCANYIEPDSGFICGEYSLTYLRSGCGSGVGLVGLLSRTQLSHTKCILTSLQGVTKVLYTMW